MAHCCTCTPYRTCDYCSSQSAFSAPVSEIAQGSSPWVSDRNGNPKKLKQVPQSLLAGSESGTVKMRTGALNDPIILGALQTLLDGKGVLVRNGQGVIGVATPIADDLFLAHIGGVVQWVSTIPRSNVFTQEDFQPLSGRLVTVSCVIDGRLTLGYMDLGTVDYLYSVNGIIRGKNFCDAPLAETADGVFVCKDGVFSKLEGDEGQVLKVNSSGEVEFITASLGLNLLASHYLVACKVLGSGIGVGQESWSNSGVAVGSFDVTLAGVPESAEFVWVRGNAIYDINAAATTVTAYVKVNGLLLCDVIGVNFGEVSDRAPERTWAKVTNKLITYELGATSSNTAQGSAGAKLEVLGWM